MSENNKDLNLNDQNKLDILEEKLNKLSGIVNIIKILPKNNQTINSLEKLVYNIKIQNFELDKEYFHILYSLSLSFKSKY